MIPPTNAARFQHDATAGDWLSYVAPTLRRSPLYAHLYEQMQQDPPLFALLALIDPTQPVPVLFFSVVNFLVLQEPMHSFAHWYPYLVPTPRKPEEAYPTFRAFCLEHLDALRALLPTSRLQTNEVRRCANLLPAFELVFQRGGQQPLALIEIGASAGLNLNWFRYGYQYGTHVVGDPSSPVQLCCELSGNVPPLPTTLPRVGSIVGIELCPLDVKKEQEFRWLQACIWPEESERYRLLGAAVALARRYPPQIVPGDACEHLAEILAATPLDRTLCVWHSFALNQGPAQVRAQIVQTLREASRQRMIFHISLEADPTQPGLPRLELCTYRKGDLFRCAWLAECDFHGETMEWFG